MAYKKIDKYLDSFYAGEILAKELVELDKKGEFSI